MASHCYLPRWQPQPLLLGLWGGASAAGSCSPTGCTASGSCTALGPGYAAMWWRTLHWNTHNRVYRLSGPSLHSNVMKDTPLTHTTGCRLSGPRLHSNVMNNTPLTHTQQDVQTLVYAKFWAQVTQQFYERHSTETQQDVQSLVYAKLWAQLTLQCFEWCSAGTQATSALHNNVWLTLNKVHHHTLLSSQSPTPNTQGADFQPGYTCFLQF